MQNFAGASTKDDDDDDDDDDEFFSVYRGGTSNDVMDT